ncbi:MAG: electron transfer flavoprotein subunit beta/FixA family protein [Candidatus Wallbacteria bacterium]|nr:electron transfer flavoprotein subunit beta/FixA family protein [Candidatus Wallbacteria bacterium]
MRIIVPIKQVPGITDVKINKEKGTLEREGIFSIINPEDKNALELALSLKDENGAEVIIVSMGPPQAQEALIEALAMGGDKAYLVTDRKFAGADTWATAYTLSKVIEKIGKYDLVICGRQAIDGDTAQVGPQLANFLEIPQVTYARKIEIKERIVTVEREIEGGHELIDAGLPLLLTVTGEINKPRFPRIDLIFDVFRENRIERLTASDLKVDPSLIGLDGSPTKVKKVFNPKRLAKGEILEGPAAEVAGKVVNQLRDKGIV